MAGRALSKAQQDELLDEIRGRYEYAKAEWAHIREDARKDMLCIAGQVWEALDPEGLKQRKEAKRPALSLDEIGQYIDQTVNSVRANPRAVKFSPGEVSTTASVTPSEKTASFYADKTREIEYRSKAQIVYTTAFENAVQRGYGFCRVTTRYVRGSQDRQDIWLEPFVNPDLVLPDPDCLMPDSSDQKYCFVLEGRTTIPEFKREYPNAKIVDFSGDLAKNHPDWVGDNRVQLAEYWTVDGSYSEGTQTVCQYITNGVEILKSNEWAGRYIPIVSCYGKVLYVPESGKTKRHMVSMTRLARDPLMLYCYYRTQQAEMAGMIPKTPVTAYEGQMEGYEAEWQRAAREPVAFLYFKGSTEGTGGAQNVLPPPSRLDYHAGEHLQALELCAEGARRAIQAAMAGSPLPTAAQRRNEKSGKALQRIEESQQRGSFHFVDHYNAMIEQVGIVVEDLMDKIYDTARTVGVRKPDDTTELVPINDPQQQGAVDTRGDYLVTVSTGPNFDSQREETSDFLDTLISGDVLPLLGPEKAPKLIAQAIKMRNLGPGGDHLAEIVDPSLAQDSEGEISPQQLQAKLEQAMARLQQVEQAAQQMAQQLETDAAKQQATIAKAQIDAQTQLAAAKMAEATKLAIAKLVNLVKPGQEQQAEAIQAEMDRAHDMAMAEVEHQHDMELERLKAEHAQQQAEIAAAQGLIEGEQGHAHEIDSAERGHRHALEQGDQQVRGKLAVEASKPKPAPKGEQ